jgi:8-oxo-dGTP pyrophosphatase MutT (NUDIX family)
VIQALSAAAGDGATVRAIRAAADAFLESPHAIRLLGSRARDVEPQYSTPELLAIETRILDDASRLQRSGRGAVAPEVTDSAIDRRPFLADEQCTMVRRLTQDGDGVAVIIGRAGTGKTTALAAAREAWEQSGLPVRGCALARRAARELEQKAGLRATSVAGLLHRPRALPPGTVLLVDEAGMLGTRDLEKLLDLVGDAQGKLVLAGDTSQLPSIRAGGALRALSARLEPIVLRENRRQRLAWEREAVEALRAGDHGALERYADEGRLVVGRDDHEVLSKLVADWHGYDDPDGAVMIAHRRADVAELNARARAVMRATSQLGTDELVAAGATFAAGDRVLVKRNDNRCPLRRPHRRARRPLPQPADADQPPAARARLRHHGLCGTGHDVPSRPGPRTRRRVPRVDLYDDDARIRSQPALRRRRAPARARPAGVRARRAFKNGRLLLAAALQRTRADDMAIERLLPEQPRERSIGREL